MLSFGHFFDLAFVAINCHQNKKGHHNRKNDTYDHLMAPVVGELDVDHKGHASQDRVLAGALEDTT
jgi:hypothetical protein